MDKVKVELLTQHEHANRVLNRGDVIEVFADQANVLIAKGVAKKVGHYSAKGREDKE